MLQIRKGNRDNFGIIINIFPKIVTSHYVFVEKLEILPVPVNYP